MLALQSIYQDKLKSQGVKIIGVTQFNTSHQEAQAFEEQNKITFPSIFDEQAVIATTYGVTGVPHYVYIDKKGRIATYTSGARGIAVIEDILQALLKEPSTPTKISNPNPTPNPYQLSAAFKPSDIQSLSQQGHFVSAQYYKAIGCYHDPNPSQHIREWLLFTTPDQAVNENSFAVHYIEPVLLQHGTCYLLTIQHLGPTEWRACRTEPYGANCTTDSPDFLWERDIPAFRGTAEATIHLWKPPEK